VITRTENTDADSLGAALLDLSGGGDRERQAGATQYLAFLRSAEAKSIFEGYGFSVLAKPTS